MKTCIAIFLTFAALAISGTAQSLPDPVQHYLSDVFYEPGDQMYRLESDVNGDGLNEVFFTLSRYKSGKNRLGRSLDGDCTSRPPLAMLKLDAAQARSASTKGQKDRIDLLTLLDKAENEFKNPEILAAHLSEQDWDFLARLPQDTQALAAAASGNLWEGRKLREKVAGVISTLKRRGEESLASQSGRGEGIGNHSQGVSSLVPDPNEKPCSATDNTPPQEPSL